MCLVKNMLGCWAVMYKIIPSSNVTEKTLNFDWGGGGGGGGGPHEKKGTG